MQFLIYKLVSEKHSDKIYPVRENASYKSSTSSAAEIPRLQETE